MNPSIQPVTVEFPLRGEWAAPNTPGTRIPSHGTNILGSRYAYDFLQINWNKRGRPCYQVNPLHYLLFGISVSKCYCYGKDIFAPCNGTVIAMETACKERKRAFLMSDLYRAKKNSSHWKKNRISTVTGNYIIIKHNSKVYAAICHLQPDSIKVSIGQHVEKGDFLGKVGHTGNSMFPHLHFQLMDSPDINCANGIPCDFEQYEVYRNGRWEKVYHSIPKATDRIRFLSRNSFISHL